MKKIVLFILLLLPLFNYGQTITKEWTVEQEGKWGSFYWKVIRNTYPDVNGKYWYYIYFYSNSLFNTDINNDNKLDKATTYIKNINIIMDIYNNNGYYLNTIYNKIDYILCDYKYNQNQYSAWFWSYQTNVKFSIKYSSVTPYSYSYSN